MEFVKGLCIFGLSFGVIFCAACVANAQVSFVSNPLWLSAAHVTEGVTVQASTVVTKQSADAISGTITFYANGKSIGTSDFSLPSSVGGVVVAVSFVPAKGTHLISAKMTRAVVSQGSAQESVQVSEEVKAKETLVVDPDNDRDGIADASDPDDDNDGVSDVDEKKNGTNPLVKEVSQNAPAVAGASTTSVSGIVDQATGIAKSTGSSLFQKTETFRLNSADYFDMKLAEAQKAREAKEAETLDTEADLDAIIEGESKPLLNKVKDGSGVLEGAKTQAYKALSFIFHNVYAFYIIIIIFVLWILRKIWKRFSLD